MIVCIIKDDAIQLISLLSPWDWNLFLLQNFLNTCTTICTEDTHLLHHAVTFTYYWKHDYTSDNMLRGRQGNALSIHRFFISPVTLQQ